MKFLLCGLGFAFASLLLLSTVAIAAGLIATPLTITTSTLPNGTVGVVYGGYNIDFTGGNPPITWSIVGGTLPPGLNLVTLSASHHIGGTPTVVGTYTFTVQGVDIDGVTAPKTISIGVSDLKITTTSVTGGTVGAPYFQALSATGGVAPFTWSMTAGTIPQGLSLDTSTGAISGTPTEPLPFRPCITCLEFTVAVTDAAGFSFSETFLKMIIAPQPSIDVTALPGGTLGKLYHQVLPVSGGTAPLTLSLVSGQIPAGLNLGPIIGGSPGSIIDGTPTSAGTSNFTLQVTDEFGAIATRALSIEIKATLSVNKAGTGDGQINSSVAGILCGTACSATFSAGQAITLNVSGAAAGTVFSGWSGDPDCSDGLVTMSADRNCIARFDLPQSNSARLRGDFDGDGITDIAVYRPSTGEWFLRLSSQGYTAAAGNYYFKWGAAGDIPVVGDFDGDRKTDIATYRPTTGEWSIRLSSQNYVIMAGNWYFQWGIPGDIPISADFDGDRITDIAVYRPLTGEWFLRLSTQNYAIGAGNWYFQWGLAGDVPITGDFDGDFKADIGVYRPSTGEWFLRLSTRDYVVASGNWYYQWGMSGDLPVLGDFDGDGRTDIAVYRPSTGEWLLRLSTVGYTIGAGSWYFQWGLSADRPLVGDFDGDGKSDITVFRPASGEWFLRRSLSGYTFPGGNSYFQWGLSGDMPLPR